MDKNKNNLKNINEIVSILDKIKVGLYVIVVLLLINVIVGIINTNNTGVIRNYSLTSSGNNDNNDNTDEVPEYDVSKFSEVDYAGLKKIMKDDGTHVVYIGRSSCHFCAMFIPVMTEAQEKYGFKTEYFDITRVFNFNNNSVVDQDAYNELSEYNNFFKENFLSTPMVIIFKDGKYVDGTIGYQDINTYSSFLEKNKFEKK